MITRNNAFIRKLMIVSLVLMVVAIGGYFLVGTGAYFWKENVHHYEAGAASRLFALHTMEENYRKDHATYAASFMELGIPLGAQLDGDSLIWNGPYRFRVIDVVRSQRGSVQDYRIEARPNQYSNQSKRSFLMDSVGYIHFTVENREPTLNDPAMSPEK